MEKKTKRKKWMIPAAILLVIVLLAAGVRMALKSNWLFEIIRDIAIEQADEYLNGTLAIESIRGDLLNGLTLKNIRLTDDHEDQVAEIDSVTIKYTFLSLIRSPHTVAEVEVFGSDFWITQNEDSTWNVLNLVGEIEPDEDSEPLFWAVNRMSISNLNIHVRSEYVLPDGYLNINELDANLSGGVNQQGFYGYLDDLEFYLEEARLPEQVEFYMSAAGNTEKFTLESMVINTGRTMLNSTASYEQPDKIVHSLEITPLSWRDLILYAEDLPLRQDLNIQLGISGTLENLQLLLNASATGAERIELKADLDITNGPVLKHAALHSGNLNLPLLTGMDHLPEFGQISMLGDGNIQFDDWGSAIFHGELIVEKTDFEPYKLDRFESDFHLETGNLSTELRFQNQGELISLNASLDRIFEEDASWDAVLTAGNINLANWLADEAYDSELQMVIEMKGSGTNPENINAGISADIKGSRIGNQHFAQVNFDGTIDPENLIGELAVRINNSEVLAEFSANGWRDVPEYIFELNLVDFDLAELDGIDVFPTRLYGKVQGKGRSFQTESLYVTAEMAFDSSVVNQEMIETFRANLKIEDSFATIESGLLESPIADATFNLHLHITDFLNIENQFQFDANIKDMDPLKPLFGVNDLEAEGSMNGSLVRNTDGVLQFNGYAEIDNILVDTLFSSKNAVASAEVLLMQIPDISINLELTEPSVLNIGVQDVRFHGRAEIEENQTVGMLNFQLMNGDERSLFHAGNFIVDSTRILLSTTDLTFSTPLKTLSLLNAFDLVYSHEVLQMDTLSITSADEETHLRLWIPHLDTLRQEAGIDAKNLDLGELQQAILKTSYFEGMLSGFIDVVHSADELKVNSSVQLNAIQYEDGRMDSLRFDADISDEWLQAELISWDQGNTLMEGQLRIPFIAGDPATFDERFFEREINGQARLYESSLAYWFGFIPDGLPEQTAGTITIHTELSGIAGSPELTGDMEITSGLFSGIRIDRVAVGLDYIHEDGAVDFTGNVVKDQKSILGFNASVPLHLDLRQAQINLPSDEDSVHVDIRTDDFDLALLNSYVDPEMLRNLAGHIEGEVTLTGIVENLEMNGRMQLTRGTMRIVPAGITLSETAAELLFEPNKISLREFTTRSGPGRLRAFGSVDLNALQPGSINFELTANQFRAANTPEYNFLINLDARMEGTVTEPQLRGDLGFLTGQVNLQNFGDRTVETVVLEEEEQTDPFDFYDALTMELNVDFGRQFLVRNRQYLDMEIVLNGSLDLLKERNEELQMFGTLEGIRGFARPLGRNFDMDEAIVSFFGPVENPQLNIRTRYEPPQSPGVSVFYVIDGTLQDPEFRFESEPEMELQDIVSYTIFGKPFYELDSWEQVVAGSGSSPTAADIALDVLLDRVEMLASQRLGIDVVQIDNTRSGSRNTTSIKTGWYLNQRTFFAILNEVGGARPQTLFMLEYLLHENLELIITQGDDSREGIDLRWKLDY